MMEQSKQKDEKNIETTVTKGDEAEGLKEEEVVSEGYSFEVGV